MDNFVLGESGKCNYCEKFFKSETIQWARINSQNLSLDALIKKIQLDGKHKKYDCVVGISGGLDSAYVLKQAVECGLRPYVIHMNNTWNDSLAELNISRLVESLGLDLHTKVLNCNDYDMALSSLIQADVVDLEILYDNCAFSLCYQAANNIKTKYILGGQNYQTEGYAMPASWNWFKYDKTNLYAICKIFSNQLPLSLPLMGTLDFFYYEYIKNISIVPFLDFFSYNKNLALSCLEKNNGYTRYPYKHYESILTRFYQAYILPKKFSIDKRIGHLSNLVLTGQLDREKAANSLKLSPYDEHDTFLADKHYFTSRLGLSNSDLQTYLTRPRIEHSCYPSEIRFWNFCSMAKKIIMT